MTVAKALSKVGLNATTKVEGELHMVAGSTITNDGTQAAAIAAVTTNANFTTTHAAALNGVIVALEGVGILATS